MEKHTAEGRPCAPTWTSVARPPPLPLWPQRPRCAAACTPCRACRPCTSVARCRPRASLCARPTSSASSPCRCASLTSSTTSAASPSLWWTISGARRGGRRTSRRAKARTSANGSKRVRPARVRRVGGGNAHTTVTAVPEALVVKDFHAVAAWLRAEHGATSLGHLGFCWGGRYSIEFARRGLVTAAASPHPSFLTAELVVEAAERASLCLLPSKGDTRCRALLCVATASPAILSA